MLSKCPISTLRLTSRVPRRCKCVCVRIHTHTPAYTPTPVKIEKIYKTKPLSLPPPKHSFPRQRQALTLKKLEKLVTPPLPISFHTRIHACSREIGQYKEIMRLHVAHVHSRACVCICICTHIHSHTYIHIHTYAHAHIHAYMHTRI